MGTLSIQPPTGSIRNLTEVFILLRNNALHNKFIFANNTASAAGWYHSTSNKS